MRIISTIKGFVTNSSSANYWLNDEVLKDAELKKYLVELREKEALSKKESSTGPQIANSNQNQVVNFKFPQKISSSIFLFLGFFTILATVLVIKKMRNK